MDEQEHSASDREDLEDIQEPREAEQSTVPEAPGYPFAPDKQHRLPGVAGIYRYQGPDGTIAQHLGRLVVGTNDFRNVTNPEALAILGALVATGLLTRVE